MINVGILGFAHGHVFGFGEQWQKNPDWGVQITKGWDLDEVRRADGCKRLDIAEADSAEALLTDKTIGAVVIASQTLYHADLAVMAAKAGKKIIVYKPIALTLEQADRIVSAVQEYNTDFTMAWQMRTDPINEQMRALITGGALGKPYYFRRRHGLALHNDPNFKNMWHVDERLNRDIFADDSAHPIDWMLSLFGMPESVVCELSTMHDPAVRNDLGAAIFRYPSGLLAEITFCASCSAAEITTECYFERGALQHYGGDGVSTRLPHAAMPSLKWFVEGESDWHISDIPVPAGQWERICGQGKPLADFLCGRRPPIATAKEGKDALRAVLACYTAANEGRRLSDF